MCLRRDFKGNVAGERARRGDHLDFAGGGAGGDFGINDGRGVVEDGGGGAVERDAGGAFQAVADNCDRVANFGDARAG